MSKMLKLSSLSVAAIVLGMSVNELKAAPIVIDAFAEPTSSYPLFDMTIGGPQVSSGLDAGVRVVTLSTTAKQVGADFTSASLSSSETEAGAVYFNYNSTSGAAGVATISYGSAAAGASALSIALPQDYSFFIPFSEFDLPSGAPLTVTLTLFNGAASSAQTAAVTTAGATTLAIDGNLFNPLVSGNITGLTLSITAPKAADYRLGGIVADSSTIIPEPTALAFTTPGALALLARRRRA